MKAEELEIVRNLSVVAAEKFLEKDVARQSPVA
jgi:hypothetical protein